MSFCIQCGSSLPETSRFCTSCGKAVDNPGSVRTTSPTLNGCRYHPTAPKAGTCLDCKGIFCPKCAIEIVRHGTVCLDCGTKFAEKKLGQAYIAAALGLVAGIIIAFEAFSERNWGFALVAPFIYTYFFAAVFFGWHYGGKIWKGLGKVADHTAGTNGMGGFVGDIVLFSIRLTTALILGVFGGGIVQYLRYRNIVKFHESLSSVSVASGATA